MCVNYYAKRKNLQGLISLISITVWMMSFDDDFLKEERRE